MRFSLKQLARWVSSKGLCIRSRGGDFHEILGSRQMLDSPVPVTVPGPRRGIRYSIAAIQHSTFAVAKGSNLHLQVVPRLAKGAARVADPKVVDPARQDGIDLRDQHLGRSRASAPDGLTDFRLDGFAGLLLRSHPNEVSPLILTDATQVESQEPKGIAFQQVHHFGFLLVQLDPDRSELFLESLKGPFGPAPFTVVAIDGDDNIVSESMIVHCLIGSLRRFAADGVEGPIGLVQVDIRRQRTERAPLAGPRSFLQL